MSHLRDTKHIHCNVSLINSPTFPNYNDPAGSPMTNLALNLSDASLASTPRRRLSLSASEETPTRFKSIHYDHVDTAMDTPVPAARLLKNAIRFPGSGQGAGGGSAAAGLARGRGLARRINMSPLLAESPHSNKENQASVAAAAAVTAASATAASAVAPAAGLLDEPPSPAVATFLSPSKHISPSKFASPLRQRQPLEDHDPNSQDSGYGTIFNDKDDKSGFRFMEPVGLAPRRQPVEQSPGKNILSPNSRSSGFASPTFFHTLSSESGSGTESIDDGFLDILDNDKLNEDSPLPTGISYLISGPLKEQNAPRKDTNTSIPEQRARPVIRRHMSLIETSTRVQRCPFRSSVQNENEVSASTDIIRLFKRPDPPVDNVSALHCSKRPKINLLHAIPEHKLISCKSEQMVQKAITEKICPVRLQRSHSETEATIKRALQRSTQEPDLIGDFSKPFVLPLMEGRHQDLKAISCETLSKLIKGEYDTSVESYVIVDCRYPYEYEGGHIKGAKNMYTQEQILKEFVETSKLKPEATTKRNILVFHCEFSSERGPKLSRFLRNSDRVLNKEHYPALHYPEVYLLHGGYKEFFENYSEFCEPCSYLPMLDPNHDADLRHFRAKTKSGSGDSKSRLAMRSNLKRLGL